MHHRTVKATIRDLERMIRDLARMIRDLARSTVGVRQGTGPPPPEGPAFGSQGQSPPA